MRQERALRLKRLAPSRRRSCRRSRTTARRPKTAALLGPTPRRSALRKNRRLSRAETIAVAAAVSAAHVAHLQAARLPPQQKIVASLARHDHALMSFVRMKFSVILALLLT